MSDLPAADTPENITCSNCGSAQLPAAQFCTSCGALLTATPPSPEPSLEGAAPPSPPSVPFETPPVGPGGGYPIGGEPPKPPYPVSLEFEGPEQVSRLSSFFRLILAIPLLFFLAVIGWAGNGILAGLILTHWLSLLVRGGRPVGWIGSAIVALLRFYFRAYAYLLLLTDKYPAFEGDWFLQLEMERPERIRRRQIFFWKTLAVVPHLVGLSVLWFGVAVCEVIAWFAILFTGRFPLGLRSFVVGYMRWGARVTAYWISMRDEFPPYSLSSEATAGSRAATGFSAAGGLAAVVLIGVGIGVAIATASGSETEHVSYAELNSGRESSAIIVGNVEIHLTDADDNYAFPGELLVPEDGARFVMIEAGIFNLRTSDIDIFDFDFELRDADGDSLDPAFVTAGGTSPPAELKSGDFTSVLVVFEVDDRGDPLEFRYDPQQSLKGAKFVFD